MDGFVMNFDSQDVVSTRYVDSRNETWTDWSNVIGLWIDLFNELAY